MLASISPLGERARGNRWGLTVAAFAAGSVVGAAFLGGVLGEAGAWLARTGSARWAVAIIAVLAGVWDLAGPGRIPGVRRQVDERWLSRYRGWVYGAGFGVQLGVGVATIVSTASVYAWMAAAVMVRDPAAGSVVGACFGLSRAAMIGAVRNVDDPSRLRARLRTLAGWSRRARLGAGAASVAVGAGCAAIAATGIR